MVGVETIHQKYYTTFTGSRRKVRGVPKRIYLRHLLSNPFHRALSNDVFPISVVGLELKLRRGLGQVQHHLAKDRQEGRSPCSTCPQSRRAWPVSFISCAWRLQFWLASRPIFVSGEFSARRYVCYKAPDSSAISRAFTGTKQPSNLISSACTPLPDVSAFC